ncbi:MAG: helix-turn-helix domain-containing protein [Caldisericum exile]|uniref:helix-turn-helix domain-containing protein n=1 Tax=Caldisericum exile TaxID=693075 RepID=UPI003C755B27
MDKQKIIIASFLEGKSKREIARETGIDRKTIRKYIKQYEEKRRELINIKEINNPQELIDSIVEAPKYNSLNRNKRKLTEEIIRRIKYYLEENEQKKKLGQRNR